MDYLDYQTARQNNLQTVKFGSVELYGQEIKEYYESGRIFIVQYRKIYQIRTFNAKNGCIPFAGNLLSTFQKPLTRRGRFYAMTAKQVNELVGLELVTQ